jgi:SMODS and SLOG-associating 2TM effector domain 1/Protein of unknown function (DUF4231)
MKSKEEIKQVTLDYLSRQIDIWNTTATKKKKITVTWRKRMFALILMGTFFGLLSQEFINDTWSICVFEKAFSISQILALASGVSIALSTFAGAQILTSDLERTQIKSRSTAEALKVQAYLYLMNANPYSKENAEKRLYERVESILSGVKDITPFIEGVDVHNSLEERLLRIITFGIYNRDKNDSHWVQKFDINMKFDDYFEERVKGQINGYYLKKAAEFQRVIKRGNSFSIIFGFIGVAIGASAATGDSGNSMWIAFLSAASASIASYLHSNKYEYLMLSYISTASQLELITAKHQSMVTMNQNLEKKLVVESETIFAMEENELNSWAEE